MEGILLADSSDGVLLEDCSYLMGLKIVGVVVAPEKTQWKYFFQYLCPQLSFRKTVAQKIQIQKDVYFLQIIFKNF